MIEIKDITIEKIKSGEIKNELPEFYDLKDVFENNSWHHETTFEHVLSVLEKYNNFLDNHNLNYLDEKVENNSKKDLLKIAILLHDMSKKETIVQNDDGTTSFPKHEAKGGMKIKNILDRFNIADKEKEYIISIVSNHGQPHNILSDRENCEQKLKDLENEIKDFYRETLILVMCDTMGSKLKENNEEEYSFRVGKYKDILDIN